MAPATITFSDTILALHTAAVMIAFGVTFSYPLLFAYATRQEPRHLPAFWRAVALIGQRIVAPGTGVVLAAGIYLATDEHQWSKFYVGWGLAAALALGALGGAFFAPLEKRLAAAAERDVATAGAGPVTFSDEYEQLRRRWTTGGISSWVLVVVRIVYTASTSAPDAHPPASRSGAAQTELLADVSGRRWRSRAVTAPSALRPSRR